MSSVYIFVNFQLHVGDPFPFPEHFTDTFVPAARVKAAPFPSPLMLIKSTLIVLMELSANAKSPLDTMIGAKKTIIRLISNLGHNLTCLILKEKYDSKLLFPSYPHH